jgi:chromosomal replication initiator protein
MSDVWASVKERVSSRIGRKTFRDWFEPTQFLDVSDGKVRVGVPNVLFKEWMENNFAAVVDEVLVEIAEESRHGEAAPRRVLFVVPHAEVPEERAPERAAPVGPTARAGRAARRMPTLLDTPVDVLPGMASEAPVAPTSLAREQSSRRLLDLRYTFENFVVGSCNQFAHAAARAVVDNPGRSYNPLYLYGGVGLGKTHLMQAIGHALLADRPDRRLVYASAERFMCEMINAIRWKRTPEFRDRFRSVDILLVDDIQFLEGKEATQEEFFHTFRTLYEDGKQIVLSGDCPPRELATLEERLRSRFESGLIADMQVPDLETKLAILRRRSEAVGIQLEDDVALFLSSKVRSNVRELEGCLTRLVALASLRQRRPDLDLAKEATRDLFPEADKPISVEAIQRCVADHFHVRVSDLKARNNARSVAFPRQVAMYLAKKMTPASFPDIGKRFGGKHHSTVIHSVNKISAKASQSEDFNRLLNRLIQEMR